MATQVQRRRGTTTEHSTFTGAAGELTVDTEKEVVVVHDGTTAGGFPAARQDLSTSTGAVTDATVSSNAAIDGTKITPAFGAQNVSTLGGAITARAGAGNDGIALNGTIGGTTNLVMSLSPATLSTNVTVTIPGATATLINTTSTQTITGGKTFQNTAGILTHQSGTVQDGLILRGNGVGTGSFRATIQPASLTASRTITLPDAAGTAALLETGQTFSGNNTFTGANQFLNGGGQVFRAAATQDGISLNGRLGGTGNFVATLQPTTLTATRTLTLPDVSGTVVTSGDTGSVTSAMIADGTIVNGDINATAAIAGTKIAPSFGAQLIQSSAANQALSLTGSLNPAATSNGLLSVGTLGFSGARMGGNFTSSQTSYYQLVLQNTNNGSGASTDFVVCNDISTDTTTYGNFGINSSTYAGAGSFSLPNGVYLTATGGTLLLGTTGNTPVRVAVNNESVDALSIDTLTATFTKDVALNAQKSLRFYDADSSNYVGFDAPATVAANVLWELPAAEGNPMTALVTNGAGVLAWEDVHILASKPANTTRNNTVTLTADPDLQFAMTANTTYNFKLSAFFSTTAAGDFKYGFTGPAGATQIIVKAVSMAPGAAAYTVSAIATAYNTAGVAITSNNAGNGFIELEGIIQNGANAGNFQFTWAQNTSDAGPTLVYGGCYVKYDRVP